METYRAGAPEAPAAWGLAMDQDDAEYVCACGHPDFQHSMFGSCYGAVNDPLAGSGARRCDCDQYR